METSDGLHIMVLFMSLIQTRIWVEFPIGLFIPDVTFSVVMPVQFAHCFLFICLWLSVGHGIIGVVCPKTNIR